MSTSKQGYNGARAKILRALANNGMLTVKEISESAGLTPKQVLDNANQARVSGLCKSGRDDVTNSLGYQITEAGRAWLAANSNTPSGSDPTHKESLIVAAEEAPAIEHTADVEETAEAEVTASAEDLISPAEDRELYVISCSSTDAACQMIAETTLEDAQQKCIALAYESGADVTLYRLVPAGKTKTIVGFFSE